MKHIFMTAVLCAALFLSVLPAHAAQVPVVAWIWADDEKCGLPDASFSLSTCADAPGQTILTTDETGRLVFRDVSDGTYYLHQTAAPGLYRPLEQPLELQVAPDGSLSVEGHSAAEISILHRSGRTVLLAACAALSVLPMILRLIWLHFRDK